MTHLAIIVLCMLQAKVPKTVGEDAGEAFGGADFIGLGKWCARQRLLNSSGGLTVEKQQVNNRAAVCACG